MSGRSEDPLGHFVNADAELAFRNAYDALCQQRWPTPPQQLQVETRFGTTHVFHWPGTGTPIVLLHGSGATSIMWHKAIEGLAGHPLYAVDTIGEPGRSVQRAPIRDPRDFATWLDEVLSGLELNRVHLVGASYGGWLALNQALRSPRWLATISLVEPAGFQKVGVRFFLWAIACGLASVAPAPIRRRAARWLRMSSVDDPQLRRLAMLSYRRYRPRLPRETSPTDNELRSIATPALLLLGEKSELHYARRVRARTQALMPHAGGRDRPRRRPQPPGRPGRRRQPQGPSAHRRQRRGSGYALTGYGLHSLRADSVRIGNRDRDPAKPKERQRLEGQRSSDR